MIHISSLIRYIGFWLLTLLLVTSLMGQGDSSFVSFYPEKCQVSGFLIHRDYRVSLSAPETSLINFHNVAYSLGARLKYRRLGVALAVPLKYGGNYKGYQPKQYVLRVNAYPSSLVLESSIRYIQGFYQSSHILMEKIGSPIEYADMGMWSGTLSATHALSHQQFSLRSSFRFMDRQNRSKGSPLLNVSANYQNLRSDSLFSIVPYDHYRNIGLSFGAGYGQVFVYRSFFATGVFLLGLEGRELTYKSASEKLSSYILSKEMSFRAALGINEHKYFAGLQLYYHPGYADPNIFSAKVRILTVGATVGLRINPPGLVGKLDELLQGAF